MVRLAKENTGWGYTKLRDVMFTLGHKIGRTTVRRILAVRGGEEERRIGGEEERRSGGAEERRRGGEEERRRGGEEERRRG